jgi:GNAT superfamily N-acetyltransferase
VPVEYGWRGAFTSAELNLLHAEGFEHDLLDWDWREQVERHSLGWVTAREDDALVGFVNVAWDGGSHAFVLDTLVAVRARRHGISVELLRVAERAARAAGCEWLHVDFEDHLRAFYFDACGFTPTNAGLIELKRPTPPRSAAPGVWLQYCSRRVAPQMKHWCLTPFLRRKAAQPGPQGRHPRPAATEPVLHRR